VAALAADPKLWKRSGGAYASWDLAEEYGVDDADGRRPHWGRHFEARLDELWSQLVERVRGELRSRGVDPDAALEQERASLTLRVRGASGDTAERVVLAPEAYLSDPATIAREVVRMYDRLG
jgi:hypothetical protein